MKSTSVKKWTILGLVLMAASAVTAAVLPSNTSTKVTGALADDSGSGGAGATLSCVTGSGACTLTALSDSTNVTDTFSTGQEFQTDGNTSVGGTSAA